MSDRDQRFSTLLERPTLEIGDPLLCDDEVDRGAWCPDGHLRQPGADP